MDHFVTLERRPESLRMPAACEGRFWYDETRRRLVHHGFMSKADFDRFVLLSDDWAYRRALEELFRLCGPEESRCRGLLGRVASVFGL